MQRRIGILGSGAIARIHCERWQRLPVTIAGHYDLNPAAATAASQRFGGAAFVDLDDFLAQVDMVDICTPTVAHKENVLAAAAAGKPIICEKPLARHLGDCAEMIEACRRAGVALFVAHVVCFFPEFARAKAVLESGAIGTPGVIRTVRAGSMPGSGGTQMAARCYATAQQLLDQGVDGVIVCAENIYHRALVELAAGQTGAILCEKPIATTLDDGQAMIDRCAAAGSRLQIAFPVRFAPPIQQLKALLAEGSLGQVYAAQCTNHGQMPGGWFVDRQLAGGGAAIDHTVHVIDVLRWLWQTEVTEVYAEVGESLLHPDLGIDDAGMLSFTLANGVYGTLDTSWSRPHSYPVWGDVKIEIVAEQGIVYVDAYSQTIQVSSDRVGKTEWHGWGSNADMGLIQDFVEMVRRGREPSITGLDGLKALEVALAAYASAASGAPLRLGPQEISHG